MTTPLNYLELVIEIVRGRSPVPEHGRGPDDRMRLAEEHLAKLKEQNLGGSSGNEMLDQLIEAGPAILCMLWDKMCPAALTMCGDKSLDQLVSALQTVEKEKIPGDLIETGVWRGGLPIIMRAFLHSVENRERKVWLADSFKGLPNQTEDSNDRAAHLLLEPIFHLSVSRKQVENSLRFFGLLDDQVEILEGWFRDTLKTMPNRPLALIRLDGDYYESTLDALEELYPRLSPGGFLIVDDYNLPLGCKRAVDEYRLLERIQEPLIEINSQAVFWRK